MGIGEEEGGWQRADEVFGQLLGLPPEARMGRLAGLGLPVAVRERVERMLAALQDDASGILDEPERLAAILQADALAGRRLGRWQLEREIGRGGMSVVYRAVSLEGPAGQAAAVKVLTLATLAEGGTRQFLREQDSLLRLRHPYIAPLFDAGVADDGTPWLAMALVDGKRIDSWCDGQGADARARVLLVLQVCEAVAHAHRNLLVHRDIKPSNVLVDEDGRVRLLDFGIARAVDAEGDVTTTAMRALTPGYAAPEQIDGAPPATTMDIYGIGALLHRLVAGSPPPGAGGIHAGGIRAGDTRVRGDLGAILGKALAADPAQRYSNVEALDADLRNWLAGRPVAAQPPSLRYRFGKFVARHRMPLAGAALLVLLLAGGVASTVHQMQRARAEADRAVAAKEESDAHRKYMSRVFAVLVPSGAGDVELDRAKILDQLVADAREQFRDRPALLSSVELDLGVVAQNLELYELAQSLLQSSIDRRVAEYGQDHLLVAEAKAELGKSLRGGKNPDRTRAGKLLAEAVATFRAKQAPATVRIPALLVHAVALDEQGRNDDAWDALVEAATFCPGDVPAEPLCERVLLYQGVIAGRSGRPVEALAALRPLYALRSERYGDTHVRTLVAGTQLAEAMLVADAPEEAVALLESVRARQAKTYPPTHGELVVSASLLARAYLGIGRIDDARKLYAWTIERGVAIGGNNTTAAHAWLGAGLLEHRDGNYSTAGEYAGKAHAMFVAMQGAGSPAAAAALGYRADALREAGRLEEAQAMHVQALELTREAFGAESARVASRLANLARTQVLRGQPGDALDNYDAALVLYRKAQRDDPADTGVAAVLAWRSRALLASERGGEALADLRTAVADLERLGARNQREYREAFALLTDTACRLGAADCGQLQARCGTMASAGQLPGRARRLLRNAANGTPLEG